MKKLGIVAALALVTTVGGVYATWNYKGNAADSLTEQLNNGITITDAHVSGVYGVMDVVSDTLSLKIHNTGNYVPGWTDYSTGDVGGKLAIMYDIYDGAPAEITVNYTVTIENNLWDMDGDGTAETPILNLATAREGLAENEILKGSVTIDGVANAGTTVTAVEWNWAAIAKTGAGDAGWLEVNTAGGTLALETYEEYTRYRDAVKDIKISVAIEDKTAATTPTTNP